MSRPWMRPRLIAALAVVALATPLATPIAHAGLIEASMLTEQSARLTSQAAITGPDWSPSRTGALPPPSGASPRVIRGRGRAPAPPPRVERPLSGQPGTVAGLVYETGTKSPIANVTVMLVSTEPHYVESRYTDRTDSAGYYEFGSVEPGLWRLSIQRDGLPMTWAVPRTAPALSMAKLEKIAVPPFILGKQACVEGHTVWSDGYNLADAPISVIPATPGLGASGGLLNGIGDYDVCEAPEDSAMVWMHLRDGRSLGHATRLKAGVKARVDFKPDPIERMEGSPLRVLPVLTDGTPVARAKIVVVGRRHEQLPRAALVFVREETTDADGVAEFKVPFGDYEVLVMNPREGQTGTQQMVVTTDQTGRLQPLKVELTGTTSAEERAAMKRRLLERAEKSLIDWTQ